MNFRLKEGLKVGVEWSRISALFQGSEVLISKLRDKQDRWNSYIGSGILSAALRYQEGPIATLQG
jgi:hypothetical protein